MRNALLISLSAATLALAGAASAQPPRDHRGPPPSYDHRIPQEAVLRGAAAHADLDRQISHVNGILRESYGRRHMTRHEYKSLNLDLAAARNALRREMAKTGGRFLTVSTHDRIAADLNSIEARVREHDAQHSRRPYR